MSTKNVKTTGDLESRVTILENRITALEKLSKRIVRRKKQYTDEEKKAIRARLLAGQEAARKKGEAEAKGVNKPVNHGTKEVRHVVPAK